MYQLSKHNGSKANLYISPEVEHALCILDTAIAVLKGNKAGNVITRFDATLEESSAGSRTSQTGILNADDLLNGHPVTTVPQGSRSA
jgi:hypothetical protein